ncbi:GFA family protein [Henriciella sp.]|uniref:GFA family protein n=1 Tax=Henriciella sp. TaxID=1968823 RepID=UPI002617E1BB|nr:GFA family protein [Henriciella sp.]
MADLYKGKCHCGAVQYQGQGKPHLHVCHCSDCLGWNGGPFIAAMFDKGITLQTADAVKWYESSEVADRGSCATCGTVLFYRGKGGEVSSVAAGTLSDQAGLPDIGEHIFIDEKPAYYDFKDDAPRLTGAEVIANFQDDQS